MAPAQPALERAGGKLVVRHGRAAPLAVLCKVPRRGAVFGGASRRYCGRVTGLLNQGREW
jgi:hypothetical protein